MARRKTVTNELDIQLQVSVIDAIATYFDNVYEPGSKIESVGSGLIDDEGRALAYVAFRVPEEMAPRIDDLLRRVSDLFDAKIIADTDAYNNNNTHNKH